MNTTTSVPNRLINEKSPYLLQHAHNPVDWFPWGEEAFAKAKAEDKPIFLSIGYSTCHWCHVMEYESFEDETVAKILNENFISIKVDREQRPDIDSIYMSACQMLTGAGGWPLSVFLDNDKNPFYAGTYFPKNNRHGMVGFISLLEQLNDIWQDDRQKINSATQSILSSLKTDTSHRSGMLQEDVAEKAFAQLKGNFDQKYGGFSEAPKFPTPHNLTFLLRYYHQKKNKTALHMVLETLTKMYMGGIYDHIGGGFSRYSTDKYWLVPHFEKMLYDNAGLCNCYIEAYLITKDTLYKKMAEGILNYVKRDMTTENGGFYSAEDADSEGIEGKFYVWDYVEVLHLLGEERGKRFCDYYNITKKGNFEEKNIPNITKVLSLEELSQFENDIIILFQAREKRIHPLKDKKIIVSWNGFMMSAFANAYKAFHNEEYLSIAKHSFHLIEEHLIKNNELFHSMFEGTTSEKAYASDYVFLITGLLDLYEACFHPYYLEKAISLTKTLMEQFFDEEQGGLFLYAKHSEQLIVRPKEFYDGAMPSDNSVCAVNLIRLSRLTGNPEFEDVATKILSCYAENINSYPIHYTNALTAFLYTSQASEEIVVTGKNLQQLEQIILGIHREFNPFLSVIVVTEEFNHIKNSVPFVKDFPIKESPTQYICSGFSCKVL